MTSRPCFRPHPVRRPPRWRARLARWLVGWDRPRHRAQHPTRPWEHRPTYPTPADTRPRRIR